MTDWLNRIKGLRMFEAIGKRQDAMEKRVSDMESALDGLGVEMRREVARLEPKTTVELPGGDIDETVRTVTVDEKPAGPLAEEYPVHSRDDPEAVHLFDEGGTLLCGIADDSILHTTVLGGTTCEACMDAYTKRRG